MRLFGTCPRPHQRLRGTREIAENRPGQPKSLVNTADIRSSKGFFSSLLEAVVAAAINGDMRAAEILLSRVWPARKGRPVAIADLPSLTSAAALPIGDCLDDNP
jgi:hypothetical protein